MTLHMHMHVGTRVKCDGGQTQTYPYIVENPSGPPRTHKQTYKYAEDATSKGSSVSSYMYLYGSRFISHL